MEIIQRVSAMCIAIVQFREYDKKSDEGSNWVRQGDESESREIVLKQVKWTFFDAHLWQTMWNHAKNRWKGPNFQIQCFTMGCQELCAENAKKKHQN